MTEDSLIHKGHRQRMRDKLISHGSKVLENYELLEMLLFYAMPYKNTNPIAKRLMKRFGDLDGVLSASVEELMEVDGVGKGIAELIKKTNLLISGRFSEKEEKSFDDYEMLGEYIVNMLSNENNSKTVMLIFDNKMRLIDCKDIYECDYSSGAVKADAFIGFALEKRAAVVVTAHNHPHGPLFPTEGDMATNRMITEALSVVGVTHIEHYIVSGKCFFGISKRFSFSLMQTAELKRFYESRERIRGV